MKAPNSGSGWGPSHSAYQNNIFFSRNLKKNQKKIKLTKTQEEKDKENYTEVWFIVQSFKNRLGSENILTEEHTYILDYIMDL